MDRGILVNVWAQIRMLLIRTAFKTGDSEKSRMGERRRCKQNKSLILVMFAPLRTHIPLQAEILRLNNSRFSDVGEVESAPRQTSKGHNNDSRGYYTQLASRALRRANFLWLNGMFVTIAGRS